VRTGGRGAPEWTTGVEKKPRFIGMKKTAREEEKDEGAGEHFPSLSGIREEHGSLSLWER